MIVYVIMESPDRYTPAYEIERIEDDRPRAFMRLDQYRASAEPEGTYDPRYYLLSTLRRQKTSMSRCANEQIDHRPSANNS